MDNITEGKRKQQICLFVRENQALQSMVIIH
jgi:hypothetical protein